MAQTDILNGLLQQLQSGMQIQQQPAPNGGDIELVKKLLGRMRDGEQSNSKSSNGKDVVAKAIKKIQKLEDNANELKVMQDAQAGMSSTELRQKYKVSDTEGTDKTGGEVDAKTFGSPQVSPASSPFSMGSVNNQGNVEDTGFLVKLLSLMSGQGLPSAAKTSEQLATADYVKNQKGKPSSNAWLDFSEQMAKPIAEAFENGDVSGYVNADRRTKTAVSALLAERGINVDEGVLGYGAEKKAMDNVKIMEAKVTAGQAAQTLLDSNYDEKTGNYVVPPAAHTELAIAVARLLSPSGVIPYHMVEELRQGTARENAANMAIWFGIDPKEVGGSTQSVIKYFAKVINRETTIAQKNRDKYKRGETADYIGMEKSGDVQKSGGVPSEGGMYNGEKVLKVEKL